MIRNAVFWVYIGVPLFENYHVDPQSQHRCMQVEDGMLFKGE